MANKICPVCKKEKYITPGCSKCLDCSRDAVRKLLAEDPKLKDALREAVREVKKDIPQMANDAANLYHAVAAMQRDSSDNVTR